MSIRINGIEKDSQTNQEASFIHGTYHMAANPNVYEPQRTSDFEFVITDLDNLLPIGGETPFTNAQEMLRLAVISAPIPHFSQSPIGIRRGNGNLNFAGVPNFQSGQITVRDWIGAQTKDMLMAWQHLSYNVKTQKVGLASEYKKDCYLIEYTPDKQKIRRWILRGCWISGISESTFDHESTDNVNMITADIVYDSGELDTTDIDVY